MEKWPISGLGQEKRVSLELVVPESKEVLKKVMEAMLKQHRNPGERVPNGQI